MVALFCTFMKKRPFLSGILNHCYQRSAGGGLLFYSQSDYLVWFTIVCVTAVKYRVTILALCPMPDHTHFSVTVDTVQALSGFMGAVNRAFSHEQNKLCHTRSAWFERSFGSVPKTGAKDGRGNLIYVGNNPVERQLAAHAEDYRWTFIAYAQSSHPFSEKLVIRDSSWKMRNAIREVRALHKSGKPMNHAVLKRITAKLNEKEIRQLTDFIIITYNVIDYKQALRFFDGSYEHFLTALHSSTGREYDLNETFVGKSDKHYAQMVKVLLKEKQLSDIHDFLAWPDSEKMKLFNILRQRTRALSVQIYKFLHLPLPKAPEGVRRK